MEEKSKIKMIRIAEDDLWTLIRGVDIFLELRNHLLRIVKRYKHTIGNADDIAGHIQNHYKGFGGDTITPYQNRILGVKNDRNSHGTRSRRDKIETPKAIAQRAYGVTPERRKKAKKRN